MLPRHVHAARAVQRKGRVKLVRIGSGRRRAFRTTVLLTILSVFNLFDLAFTQAQIARRNFAEANVVAAGFTDTPHGAAAYKVLLFGFGALVLYRYRHHKLAEVGTWCLVTCYAGLMAWWVLYLDAVEICLGDHAVTFAQIPL